jgi:hypothetical protein
VPVNYFDAPEDASEDSMLNMAKEMGAVPGGCLLNGQMAILLHREGTDPCAGCNCPREKCGGRPKSSA